LTERRRVFDLQKALYYASPIWVRNLYAKIPYGVRLGRPYRRTLRLIADTETWDADRLRTYQVLQLRELLRVAFKSVPFYEDWARRQGAAPEDFGKPEDIRKLPIVSKEQIRGDLNAFARRGRCRLFHFQESTSGTSGRSFQFLGDNFAYRMEQAYINSLWGRFGFVPMTPKATLRGREVVNPQTAHRWQYNPIHNEVNLSIYELSEESLSDYVTACAEHDVRFLHGFPSAISSLSALLLEHDAERRRFPPLRAVLAGSEGLQEGQRELMEQAFGCRVVTWYGMSERVILAGECEGSQLYHCFPQYGITELVDEEGQVITEPDVEGELVGTSFINRVMPFIRYRTGDLASWARGFCTHCKRAYPLLARVSGRAQDYLVGRDDRRITIRGISSTGHGSVFSNVVRYQFFQNTPGRAVLRLVPAPDFDDEDLQRIRTAIRQKIGKTIDLEVQTVEAVSITDSGKGRCVVQDAPIG